MYREAKITAVLPSTDLEPDADCRNLITSPHLRKSLFILLRNQKKGCRKNKYRGKKQTNKQKPVCIMFSHP